MLFEIFDGHETWWAAAPNPTEAGAVVSKAMGDHGYELEDVALMLQDPEIHGAKEVLPLVAESIDFHGDVGGPQSMQEAFSEALSEGNAPCVVACSGWV